MLLSKNLLLSNQSGWVLRGNIEATSLLQPADWVLRGGHTDFSVKSSHLSQGWP